MPPEHAYPRHRSILAVDIDGSSRRPDPIKAHLRRSMFDSVERALEAGGVAEPHRDPLIDRGDGALALIHPVDHAPKTVLLDTVVPSLSSLLAQHNAEYPDRAYRLRAVVHAGEVTYDDNGPFGEALDVALRLLDADRVKRSLRAADAPMVLVVSDDLYRCVVRHDYPGIDPKPYRRVSVSRLARCGWVRTIDA
jgi:class 3 adenylate cyclase